MNDRIISFPPDFIWGVATSSYQIEGAVHEDGRGISIWDTFSHTEGKTYKGHHGDVAADHYHRWQEDVALMADLGLKAYRFSIAWPRIQPEGKGAVNPAGLDFYDRLVDSLLAHGIQPFPTLYHWDLPQPLEDAGGWPQRDTALHFSEYARIVGDRLGDRVNTWITHNEPWVMAIAGYLAGQLAPGLQDPVAAIRATHHLLLSHGLAVNILRESIHHPAKIGVTLNLNPVHTATDSEADRAAARRYDGMLNRLFLDPVMRGQYPPDQLDFLGMALPDRWQDDLPVIAAPLDFLGVNYYTRAVVRYDPDFPIIQANAVQPEGSEYSQMWEIYPPGIYELLMRVWNDYHPKEIFITENGICVPDGVDFDGKVRDERRIRYLRDHIAQAGRALADGVPLRGYLVWSLLDNFEWQLGYQMRFGIVHVDFDTLKRTVKDSGRWYANVIKENGCLASTTG
jgi:beta-glucosidase